MKPNPHLSRGWSHDSAHFHFRRVTPVNQQHIPFADDSPQVRPGTAAASLFVALVLIVGALAVLDWQNEQTAALVAQQTPPQVVAQHRQPLSPATP